MVVMIFGVLSLVGLVVIRFTQEPDPVLPPKIAMPKGIEAEAVTAGKGWYAVVTRDQRILVFDAGSGALRQEIKIKPAE